MSYELIALLMFATMMVMLLIMVMLYNAYRPIFITFLTVPFVFIGITAIWLWQRQVASQDRAIRRKRQSREAEHVELPHS